MLKGHPVVALGREAGLAVEGQAVAVAVAVLHGLVGGPGRSGERIGVRARAERHVAVRGRVVQAATLEVRQVLERRGAHGGAGALQGEQARSGAGGQAARGAGQKVVRWVALLRRRQLGAHQTGSMCQGHGHGGPGSEVQLFSVLLLHQD